MRMRVFEILPAAEKPMTKKPLITLLLLQWLLLVAFNTTVQGEFKKTKIAVLDFELRGDSFTTKDLGGIVAEWFTTTLVKDGRFEVVERALLQKIVTEQKLGMTGLIDENSSAELGKILGVKTIITGSVLQMDQTIDVNARIINVKSGSIVAAENIRSTSTGNLKSVIEQLTSQIMKNFPLTGYIVKRSPQSVLIDLGATSGIQHGMNFIVFKEGEVIKHPKTGEVLEVEQIRTGLISISNIRSNVATATIVKEENGQQISYGQLVQSVRKPSQKTVTTAITASPDKPVTYPEVFGQEGAKKKQVEKGKYNRSEFTEGERDSLMSGGQGPQFLKVKSGSFLMGSNRYFEKPQHFVKIDREFNLTISEISFNDFERFCIETGHPFPEDNGWGQGERPVINVSWHDAKAYAKWLTQETGLTYRLPSESEWEWAAGAGTNALYNWGNKFKNDMANCKKCGKLSKQKRTLPVRSFPPNKFGFHDMSGNVWEWVEDCWVENYVNAPEDQNPRQISGRCGNYTIRGGAWNSPRRQITTTTRLGIWANTKSNYIGFRLVRETSPAAVQSNKKTVSRTKVRKERRITPETKRKSSMYLRSDQSWDEEGK